MLELLRNLARQKRLLRELVLRDLKARYVGSSMGFFWSVLYPFIMLGIYSFVFRIVLKTRFYDQASPGETILVMFAGILVWVSFSETIARCTNSLVENANLIQKVVFPSEVLAPSLAASSLVNMSIGLPLVLLGVLWVGYLGGHGSVQEALVEPAARVQLASLDAEPAVGLRAEAQNPPEPRNPRLAYSDHEQHPDQPRTIAFGPAIVCVPFLLALQMVFAVGLGYLLSAFNLLVRDTVHLIGVFTTVWMFSTPIFYSPQLIPPKFHWVLVINPMHWLISSYRDALVYGAWPNPGLVLAFAAAATFTLWVGSRFFMAQKARFPDLL